MKRRDGAADSLQEAACWALWNITADADNEEAAGVAGGVEAVIGVGRRNGADSLLEAACWA